MIDFTHIEYLKAGNARQKQVYVVLSENAVLKCLEPYDPLLVGTIPIGIDIETSDLDIICCWKDREDYKEKVLRCFGNCAGFQIKETNDSEQDTIVANFRISGFEIELFGQNVTTKRQNAYRHMLIEYNLLLERGEAFREQVIELKKKGYKTEPAFAMLLGLEGNPYTKLLELEKNIF